MHTDPENQSPSIAVADGLSGLAIAACLLAACAGPLAGQALGEMRQPFVLASGPTGQNSDRVVIFRTPHENLPTPAFQVATGLPTTYFASSATFSGPDQVLVGDPVNEAIHVIQPSTGTRLGTRTIPFYHGGGTMAAPPSYDCVLAGSFKRFGYYNGDSEDVGRDVLHVLTPPFLSGPVKRVALGGFVSFRAHRAIDFDRKTERAFVRHTNGLAVLDPPYDRVVFNLPVE